MSNKDTIKDLQTSRVFAETQAAEVRKKEEEVKALLEIHRDAIVKRMPLKEDTPGFALLKDMLMSTITLILKEEGSTSWNLERITKEIEKYQKLY